MFKLDKMKALTALVVSIIVMSIILAITSAQEPMPEAVEMAEKAIQANQAFIAEYRTVVDQWNFAKNDNNVQVGKLSAYCYTFDWAQNKAIPTPNCVPFR